MGNIRKQAIFSGALTYIGFIIGAVNIYLYTKEGSFTEAEYGLTRLFFDFAQNAFVFGSLGIIPVVYKFYPYYKDNLKDKENDLLTWSLVTSLIGFILVIATGLIFKDYVVEKYIERSALFVTYYYWLFPFAAGMLLFSVLEGFAWVLHKTVISNFLKETVLRFITTIFVLLFYFKLISYSTFIILFSSLYLFIFLALLFYLIQLNEFNITFSISRVTRKFWKKMLGLQAYIFGGAVVICVSQTIDGILIGKIKGLTDLGIFALAQYVANLIQVPQRSLQSISTGLLSRAWKEKDYNEIYRIYQRSCINLLIISIFIFGNTLLNVEQAITLIGIKSSYLTGINVMIILGLSRLIDAGTGVNGSIIATSNFWKFDFTSGIILLGLMIPLNYILIKEYGIIGSAYAQLISMTAYNTIRWEFLRRKFKMQPFNNKTLYSLLLGFSAFAAAYYLFIDVSGWLALFSRAIIFSGIMFGGVFILKLTPDAAQLLEVIQKRFRGKGRS